MKATPRTTSRYAKRKIKPEPIKIRWKKILTLPILVLVITLVLFGGKFAFDQNDLNRITKRTAAYVQQLADYRSAHPNEVLLKDILAKADLLADGYSYDEAITLLKSRTEIQSENAVLERITRFENIKNSLIVYTQDIPVIFVNSLINDPNIAFGKTSHNPEIYKKRYITTYEFKAIIDQMYGRNYILVDFYDAYEMVNGVMARKELKLPAGKIPFILMLDDIDYNDPMPLDGFARGMVLKNGEIVMRVLTVNGVEKTIDGDVVPIIENFVKDHPDFSYRGGRGILSLTGFAGTMGYRLTNKNDIANATLLAEALKAKGWRFGCTSFNNSADTYMTKPTPAKIAADLQMWKNIIQPIVGASQIFVSPSGTRLAGANLLTVESFGYKAYFTSGSGFATNSSEGMLFLSRIFIQGEIFTTNTSYLDTNFFNVMSVKDPARK